MKKLSKTAKKKQAQKINVALMKKFNSKILEKDRKIADEKDPIIISDNMEEIKDFNSKSVKDLLQTLKGSGIETVSNPFADMERIVNNNESIVQLYDTKNIRMKTKVTDEQHKIVVTLAGIYNTLLSRWGFDFRGLRNLLDEFIETAPSIDGERSVQFVTAHQALAQAVANANRGNPNAIRDDLSSKQ